MFDECPLWCLTRSNGGSAWRHSKDMIYSPISQDRLIHFAIVRIGCIGGNAYACPMEPSMCAIGLSIQAL